MPAIRHIAIYAKDPPALAEFYKTTFGMKEVKRRSEEEGGSIFVSDGYVNLAILQTHGQPEGLYHFGFQVEDAMAIGRRAREAGASHQMSPRPTGRYAEYRLHDPVGSQIDISEHGWDV
jgi:catechol 2,3-dioxygenase-like lactoylglutathione lyase family enzyme